MLSEVENRAAALAVSRFGADQARVQAACQAVLKSHALGQPAHLLDLLVLQKLLTDEQVRDLRLDLDATQLDPSANKGNPATPASFDPLQEIRSLGEYRILRRLGGGGMGTVYLGYHEGKSDQVAIKVLDDKLAKNQAYVERFNREARNGMLLHHPNIVRTLAVGQDRATAKHYLVMEFVDGPSAQALLARFGRLSIADAVHIALDVARALEHAQTYKIVHRDIKPDNLLITPAGVVKVADLGLAKQTDEDSQLTGVQQGFGTPYYMPYEQAANARQADVRSDIYALGTTLYQLVTGRLPFEGEDHLEVVEQKNQGIYPSAGSIDPEVPSELDDILDKMLARYPQDRFQTASELIVTLERSGLAAPVLSFIDADLALQDPTVRARLEAQTQATRPDLAQSSVRAKVNGEAAQWQVRFRDAEGQVSRVKGTTKQVQRGLRNGRIPQSAEACRLNEGENWRPVNVIPELRLASHLRKRRHRPKQPPRESADDVPLLTRRRATHPRWWWWLIGSLSLLALGLALYHYLG